MNDDPVKRPPWPESASRPVVTPISPSVVYSSPSLDALDAQYDGEVHGYAYSREGHPNAEVLAQKIDALEGTTGGFITGSGMAAVTAALLGLLNHGDHIIGGDQLYGRSMRLLTQDLPRFGITATLADPTDVNAMRAAIRPETRAILVEVVSNPTLRVADMEGIQALAREHDLTVIVDNTFTTPRAYQALLRGADIVVHSVTKLLAGHADVLLGYVAAKDAGLNQKMNDVAVTMGFTASPFDCWLGERGLMSFNLRFDKAQENAVLLADHLAGLEGVARVLYPMRPDHPDHNRAAHLLGGKGGNMVSFELSGGRAAANAMVLAAPDLAFAPTLGDINTTLSNPATSSHRALSPEARAALGMSDGFFRVSVGCEEIAPLMDVFTRAIKAATG
ncbi:MAG: aminotransferase class I/II-fold pyridoxal phosphate-dependent enzyme [Rhodobacteraceae bacterium]|nr:aminotransferase class I/II-fold pyridoxal phosphate-dependent enzyme [Paracoccaceae bacterium]